MRGADSRASALAEVFRAPNIHNMERRPNLALVGATVAALLLATPSLAQGLPEGVLPEEGPVLPEAPPMMDDGGELAEEALHGFEIPSDEVARAAQLESLFAELGREDNDAWPIVQAQIWRVWRRSGSESMDFLLIRALEALEEEDHETALVHLDDLVRLAPDFAEAWNQRATVYFLMGDYGRSMRDIETVLSLEPRHFGALSGLGIILDRTGNEKGALEVYRRALEIHPNLQGAQKGVERLAPDIDGREL